MRDKGKDDVFYCWDEESQSPQPMPGTKGHFKKSLRLGKLKPALSGTWEVKGKDGKSIPVTTVFEQAKKESLKFPPAETRDTTGVHPDLVERMAKDLAKADKAIVNIGFSLHKYVSGTMTCWAAALACALTGHAGERGGLDTENNWSLGGIGPLSSPKPARFASGFFNEWMNGDMEKTMRRHYSDAHLKATAGFDSKPTSPSSPRQFRQTSNAYFGKPGTVLLFADNMLQRNKSESHYRQAFIESLDLLRQRQPPHGFHRAVGGLRAAGEEPVRILGPARRAGLPPLLQHHRAAEGPETHRRDQIRMGDLPAAGAGDGAKRRRRRGIGAIPDPDFLETRDDKAAPVMRDLARLPEDFTDNGTLMNDEDVVRWLMKNVPAIAPWTPEDAMKRGFVPLNREAGFNSPLYANRPFHSFEHNVYLRQPYKTLSGRQQFYVDHPVFRQLGCTTPTAMKPLRPADLPASPSTRPTPATASTRSGAATPSCCACSAASPTSGSIRGRPQRQGHRRRRPGAGVQRRRRVLRPRQADAGRAARLGGDGPCLGALPVQDQASASTTPWRGCSRRWNWWTAGGTSASTPTGTAT